MSERLQNIINGINDGSIKFVFDYNLTMEDLFTKDNDGIYFLEYLLRKRIMIPLELKEELKTNVLAAYLYCKNGSSLFGFNLSEKDLFTEFDGKKLIEHILEKKQINKSIVESIYENLEIIDLLCNSNNYFYLNYLSQEIITKLITKDNNGKKITACGGHGIKYYTYTLIAKHGFDEMIANFAVLVKSKGAEENLRVLRDIVGDEVYNMISNFYYTNILEMDINKSKNQGGR